MTPRQSKSRFERFVLSYGAGFHLLRPIAQWKYFNAVCWVLIAVAVIGWTIDLVVYYFFWPV